jgi:hypothetical protein
MNRAVCLQRPDPNVDDLELLGRTLSKNGLSESVVKKLANLHKYITKNQQVLKQAEGGNTMELKRDLYGMRDYYHLIKHLQRQCKHPPLEVSALPDEAQVRNRPSLSRKLSSGKLLSRKFSSEKLLIRQLSSGSPRELVREASSDGTSQAVSGGASGRASGEARSPLPARKQSSRKLRAQMLAKMGSSRRLEIAVSANESSDVSTAASSDNAENSAGTANVSVIYADWLLKRRTVWHHTRYSLLLSSGYLLLFKDKAEADLAIAVQAQHVYAQPVDRTQLPTRCPSHDFMKLGEASANELASTLFGVGMTIFVMDIGHGPLKKCHLYSRTATKDHALLEWQRQIRGVIERRQAANQSRPVHNHGKLMVKSPRGLRAQAVMTRMGSSRRFDSDKADNDNGGLGTEIRSAEDKARLAKKIRDDEMVMVSICRNFGGHKLLLRCVLNQSKVKESFDASQLKAVENKVSIPNMVRQNLQDEQSRHLMLLTENGAVSHSLVPWFLISFPLPREGSSAAFWL